MILWKRCPIPSHWVVEGEQWKYGPCGEVADGGDYTSTAPATKQGLSDRLAQLRRLHDSDELVLYPWLSQSCREDAVESYVTSWVGFLELSPVSVSYWSFDDVEIIAVGSGRVAVSPVDPTNPTRFEGNLASEWIHENGQRHSRCSIQRLL